MSNALTVQDMSTMDLGSVLAQSGFFSDAKDASKAVVKVLAGRELGFGPVASMTGINIVQGKVAVGANLIAAAIKGSGKYTYRIKEHTSTICAIEFFESGESLGISSFSMDDAKAAGLSNKAVWKQYPRNMLFARAISNGAKFHTPDIFGGPVYTPEELGEVVDGETGEILSSPEPIESEPEPVRQSATRQRDNGRQKASGTQRPLEPDALREFLHIKAMKKGNDIPATEKQIPFVASKFTEAFAGDSDPTACYHTALGWLWQKTSAKELTLGEAKATLDWLLAPEPDETGDIPLHEHAAEEAQRVLRLAMMDAGQVDMFEEGAE